MGWLGNPAPTGFLPDPLVVTCNPFEEFFLATEGCLRSARTDKEARALDDEITAQMAGYRSVGEMNLEIERQAKARKALRARKP